MRGRSYTEGKKQSYFCLIGVRDVGLRTDLGLHDTLVESV